MCLTASGLPGDGGARRVAAAGKLLRRQLRRDGSPTLKLSRQRLRLDRCASSACLRDNTVASSSHAISRVSPDSKRTRSCGMDGKEHAQSQGLAAGLSSSVSPCWACCASAACATLPLLTHSVPSQTGASVLHMKAGASMNATSAGSSYYCRMCAALSCAAICAARACAAASAAAATPPCACAWACECAAAIAAAAFAAAAAAAAAADGGGGCSVGGCGMVSPGFRPGCARLGWEAAAQGVGATRQ